MWSFPKGCKEEGECNDDCWRRELGEETGITYIPFHKVLGKVDVLRYNITLIELLTDHLPMPHISQNNEEIDKVSWVGISEAMKLDLNAVTRQVLKDHHPKDPFNSFRSCRRLPRTVLKSEGGSKPTSAARSNTEPNSRSYRTLDRTTLSRVETVR